MRIDHRTPREVAHAMSRSRYASRILIVLNAEREATIDRISRKIRFRPDRTLALIEGRLPEYAPKNSLLRLGLVRRHRRAHGVTFELTPMGRRVATLLTRGQLL